MSNDKINTKANIIIPQNGNSLPEAKRQEILRTLQDITHDQIEAIGEEMSKKAEQKKLEEKSENKETGEIPQELKDFRKKWEEKINLDDDKKEKIINAVTKIQKGAKIESDGSMLVEFELGGETYQTLDVNLARHSDNEYLKSYEYNRQTKNEVKLGGMMGDKPKDRKNRELAEYVEDQKNNRKMEIPTIEFQRDLINKLGDYAGLTKESDKIAMRMYLTGNYGDYWLSMGDGKNSDSQSDSRSRLRCRASSRIFTCSNGDVSNASLCLIAYGSQKSQKVEDIMKEMKASKMKEMMKNLSKEEFREMMGKLGINLDE